MNRRNNTKTEQQRHQGGGRTRKGKRKLRRARLTARQRLGEAGERERDGEEFNFTELGFHGILSEMGFHGEGVIRMRLDFFGFGFGLTQPTKATKANVLQPPNQIEGI